MPELAFLVPNPEAPLAAALASALSEEVGRQDAAAVLCDQDPESRPGRVLVTIGGPRDPLGIASPSVSWMIAVLLEPPGTPGFEREVEFARGAGAIFHVNSAAVEDLHRLGLPARHLQIGLAEAASRFERKSERDVPVAAAGEFEVFSRAELVLVRDRGGFFDWPLALAAIEAGAVVLHERSLGMQPLVAGRHLFVGAPTSLDILAAVLLRDPQRLRSTREEAGRFLRGALPLALAAAALVGSARALVAQPLTSTPGQTTPRSK